MNIRTNLLRLLGVIAIAATASTMIAPVAANAASAACTIGTAATVVAGPHVAVTDSTGTFPDACLRVGSFYRSGNTVWITPSIRDTAHDGQFAVGLARLWYGGASYSNPVAITSRSGVEAFVNEPQVGVSAGNIIPLGVQFIACRARTASASTSSTNTCQYGATFAF